MSVFDVLFYLRRHGVSDGVLDELERDVRLLVADVGAANQRVATLTRERDEARAAFNMLCGTGRIRRMEAWEEARIEQVQRLTHERDEWKGAAIIYAQAVAMVGGSNEP